MDPIGTTLGTVALFAPLLSAGKRLYYDYCLTRTFGEDYMVVQRRIETQYIRLEELSKRQIGDIAGHEHINVHDGNDPTMKKLIPILAEMKKRWDDCADLISRYEGSRSNVTTLDSVKHKASPHSTVPSEPPESESADHKVGKKRHPHAKLLWGKSKRHEVPKAIGTPEQSKLERRTQLSILNAVPVNEEVERRRSEAAVKQSSTPFRHRISWAQSDKTALTEFAEALQHGNNEIESLVPPAPMESSALLLPANPLTEKLSVTVGKVKRALEKLHLALAKLNAPVDNLRLANQQQICQLSVQLRDDSDVNRKQLLQEPKVHLRDDSYIFNIQRQEDADPQSTADLLFAETLKNSQAQSDLYLNTILNTGSQMPELRDLTLPFATTKGVETLGFFRSPAPKYDIHVLFRDNSKQLYSPLHLADIVSSPDYRNYMDPTQLVQLVRLVMKNHLFFTCVRELLDINPRLTNFRYFCRAGEKATKWDFVKPLVLRPWMSFGFGSPRYYDLGEDQGVKTSSSPSLTHLGLVLYQICVGEVLDYGAGDQGVKKAKSTALKGLNKIDRAVGPMVTEIVHLLLSPTSLVAAGEENGEHEGTEYILNAITNLITYEEKIEDTVTDAKKEAPFPPLNFNSKRPEMSER